MTLFLAQDVAADALLASDPFALLVGMVLDQQIPLEKAFKGPAVILERFGSLDPDTIAAADPEAFAALLARPIAVHRFPAAMAERIQKLARIVLEDYDGDAASVWTAAKDGADLVRRIEALPGFGAQKARIFAALLGKQFAVRPKGWRQASAPFGDAGTYLSVADITSAATLAKVRAYKAEKKAAAKAAAASA